MLILGEERGVSGVLVRVSELYRESCLGSDSAAGDVVEVDDEWRVEGIRRGDEGVRWNAFEE